MSYKYLVVCIYYLRIFPGICDHKNVHSVVNILSEITVDCFSPPNKNIYQISSNVVSVVNLNNKMSKGHRFEVPNKIKPLEGYVRTFCEYRKTPCGTLHNNQLCFARVESTRD